MKHRRIVLAAALCVMAALLLLPLPEFGWGRAHLILFRQMENAGHPVLFAGVAWAILRLRTHERSAYWQTFIACALLGAATELAQLAVARDASFIDFLNDLLGAGAMLLLHARSGTTAASLASKRWQLGLAVSFVACAFAPLAWTGAAYVHRSQQLPILWRCDSLLDRVFATPVQGYYEGLSIDEPWPDWRGFRSLVVELDNQNATELEVTIRVHDHAHSRIYQDRFNESTTLRPHSQVTIRIPIDRIEAAPATRRMRLDEIAGVVAFTSQDPERVDFLRSARLER